MASQEKDLETICECCEKPMPQSRLLRHIGKKEECQLFYGSRFQEMKKEKGRIKVQLHRKKNNIKRTPSQLKEQRNAYANNPKSKQADGRRDIQTS